MLKRRVLLSICILFFVAGCGRVPVKKQLFLSQDFEAHRYQKLAVVNLAPQTYLADFIEGELIKKGYLVKESALVRQLLKEKGLAPDGNWDLAALSQLGNALAVQGIVFCSVLEYSRFTDSYRLSIKMVDPQNGNTLWSAQGTKEGRKGQKGSNLLQEIIVSSLNDLPSVLNNKKAP